MQTPLLAKVFVGHYDEQTPLYKLLLPQHEVHWFAYAPLQVLQAKLQFLHEFDYKSKNYYDPHGSHIIPENNKDKNRREKKIFIDFEIWLINIDKKYYNY